MLGLLSRPTCWASSEMIGKQMNNNQKFRQKNNQTVLSYKILKKQARTPLFWPIGERFCELTHLLIGPRVIHTRSGQPIKQALGAYLLTIKLQQNLIPFRARNNVKDILTLQNVFYLQTPTRSDHDACRLTKATEKWPFRLVSWVQTYFGGSWHRWMSTPFGRRVSLRFFYTKWKS